MKTHNHISTLFLLGLCVALPQSQAATLDDFIGVRWGTSIEEARKIVLSDRQRVLEKQENGITGSLSLRKGSYLGRPAAWWFLCFVNDKFCHGFVDFQLNRDQRPLYQLRQLRKTLIAKYGEPFVDVDSHPNSDPSWEECFALKPVFQCDWRFTTSGENPETTSVRFFMHGPTMESAHMRLVYGHAALSEKRDKIEHDRKSGIVPAASPEDALARDAAVREAFEKFHAAIKAGKGTLALEMRSKESLGQMTEEQKASWRRLPPGRDYAPAVVSVSLKTKTAGVYYTLKDSRGALNYYFDLFLMEDDQWKLHFTRVQDRPPDDLARAFWLPPDTAPFIEGGEDWSKIEAVPTGDPSWSVQATSDPVFLYIRFTHTTDLPLPGSRETTNDPRELNLIYTPGVSVGLLSIREGIRLSVGEVIGTRTAKKKNQFFVSYSLSFRRKGDESHSANVDNSGGVLKILGRCIDIRIPREVLTDIPINPLRIWVTPKAPATPLEYTVKDWLHGVSAPRRPARVAVAPFATPAPPAPDPALDAAKQAMRDLVTRVIGGDEKAFDELRDIARKFYRGTDYESDRKRFSSNFAILREAYDLLGEQAGKGNARAFEALKRSLGTKWLSGLAPDALGIAAALGHAEALQILLHYDQYGILKSSAVFALRASAEKKNAQAVEFYLAILTNPDRFFWHAAAEALVSSRDNPKVKAALEKYEEANKKPVEPPRPAPAVAGPAAVAPAVKVAQPSSDPALDAAKRTMRDLATRIAGGDEKAFDELRDTTAKLYRNINYQTDRRRLTSNFAIMHAAYDILGEQAGKGNVKAFEALKRSLTLEHLRSFAPEALGIAAALGHAEALQILLHHDQHKILKSSAVFALQAPAEKNNAQAIAFLIAVLDNPADRPLWYGASQGLVAVRDNPKVKAALEKYKKANQKPAEPPR